MLEAADRTRKELAAAGIRVHVDAREGMKPGAKYYEWEGRGVPLRLEIGPRDVAAGTVMLARRTGGKKESLPLAGLAAAITAAMEAMQRDMLETARARREANSIRGATKQQFLAKLEGAADSSTADSAAGGNARRRSRSRPRRRSGCCRTRSSARPRSRPPACGAAGPRVTEAVWARAY